MWERILEKLLFLCLEAMTIACNLIICQCRQHYHFQLFCVLVVNDDMQEDGHILTQKLSKGTLCLQSMCKWKLKINSINFIQFKIFTKNSSAKWSERWMIDNDMVRKWSAKFFLSVDAYQPTKSFLWCIFLSLFDFYLHIHVYASSDGSFCRSKNLFSIYTRFTNNLRINNFVCVKRGLNQWRHHVSFALITSFCRDKFNRIVNGIKMWRNIQV